MTVFVIFLMGVALAMDAFAVSVTEGLRMRRVHVPYMLLIAFFFGAFQMLMPILGWALGSSIISYVDKYDHWVGFILLAFIGGRNLYEALRSDPEDTEEAPEAPNAAEAGQPDNYSIGIGKLFLLAVATSIDALAVGVTFALDFSVRIVPASLLIGAVTFAICIGGVLIGHAFGTRYKRKAEIAGGLILIAIGLRILFDGLGIFL